MVSTVGKPKDTAASTTGAKASSTQAHFLASTQDATLASVSAAAAEATPTPPQVLPSLSPLSSPSPLPSPLGVAGTTSEVISRRRTPSPFSQQIGGAFAEKYYSSLNTADMEAITHIYVRVLCLPQYEAPS